MSARSEDIRGPRTGVSTTPASVAPALACATSDRATEKESTIAVKTFRVTLSPPEDVSDNVVNWIKKTYMNNNKFVVIEHGESGKRHLHMLLQFDQPKSKKNLRDTLWRQLIKHHPRSSPRNGLVVNTAYNMVWYTEYLRKEEDCVNVCDDFDAELFESALPDKATQAALQAAQRRKPIGAYWLDHEKRWIEFSPDNSSYESAVVYFKTRMYVTRDMEPISNLKKLRDNAYTLWAYRNKAATCDFGDTAHMKKEFDGEIIFKGTAV